MLFSARTDMASEAHRLWNKGKEDSHKLDGVTVREESFNGINITSVDILDKSGAEVLGKPVGKYFTMELEERLLRGSDYFFRAASLLSELILRCAPFDKYSSFLIAALGNEDITPDALGSSTASHIIVTRHLKDKFPDEFSGLSQTVLCRPGVLGTCGIESARQIFMLCRELKPDCVIAVDALAGADISRLCSSVQICNTGISPGSGVGNDREALNRESLGVPVIAIGVPTVIDAGFVSGEPGLDKMFVTPRDIDSLIKNLGLLLAYGINLSLHPGISFADIELLTG